MMHAKPERPASFQGDLRNLPKALAPLTALPNWVCWKWEWRVDKKGIGKWTKPPHRPCAPSQYARNNDSRTWGSYDQALAAFEAGQCDGIGFCLAGSNVSAFDLDKARDPVTGNIALEAMGYVTRAASYTEVSVSGTGLHVIGTGSGDKVHRKQKIPGSDVEIESYRGAERYIVVTGNPLPETWPHIANIDGVIDDVVGELNGHNAGSAQSKLDFNNARRQRGQADTGDAPLPNDLTDLIDTPLPPQADRSKAFHHAVCWLKDLGWTVSRIEVRIAGKPIVPERFAKRLREEIARCLHKAKPKEDNGQGKQPQPPFELFWHGKDYDRVQRSWLVRELIPETGQGLASGQWGTAKTFVVLDMAASIMTATAFAGREINRRGGVVFVAAEGANEIPIRLEGVVEQKLRPAALASGILGKTPADLELLPFAWVEDCPNLQDDNDFNRLVATIKQAAQNIRDQFDLPLVLIVIDTLSAAGSFKDANDAAEGQRVMNRLGELSRQTGAFALAVDHFGKAVETGTRGSSAKEAAADVVLALLADRDIAGNISNTRMAVRKLRGGKVGEETSFNLQVVNVRFGETTCVVEWRKTTASRPLVEVRERWPKSLRIFKSALETALIDHGKLHRPYGNEGPEVMATPLFDVRNEFVKAYPAEASDAKGKGDAKRMAFNRALKTARERN